MKYLVDTNVLSETSRSTPQTSVLEWLRQHEADLLIYPVVLAEIWSGIALLPSGKRKVNLEYWFNQFVANIECIKIDAATGLLWGELAAKQQKAGRPLPYRDSLIAASALAYDLTVVTRNVDDFERAGVRVLNP